MRPVSLPAQIRLNSPMCVPAPIEMRSPLRNDTFGAIETPGPIWISGTCRTNE